MKRRPTSYGITAAVFVGLSLAACDTPASDTPVSEPTIVDPMPPPTSESSLLSFGQDYEYPDGVTVNVDMTGTTFTEGDVVPGIPNTLPAGTEVPIFTFTITNNGTEPYRPDLETTFVTYGPETTNAGQTFTADVEGTALDIGTILPGNSYSSQRVYEVPVGSDDIIVEYGLGFDREAVIYLSD